MAEYIDRTKLLTEISNGIKAGNYEDGYEDYTNINDMDDIIETIKYSDKADVVERSEYEKLRLVNLDLAETNKRLLAEHEQLEKLRSKIDKAIEEIEKMVAMCDVNDLNDLNAKSNFEHALEILKRNIGE